MRGLSGACRQSLNSLPADHESSRDQHADSLAVAIRAALDRITLALARVAVPWARGRGWRHFGYARLDDYCRERLDRHGRWLRDFSALGEGVEALPAIGAALLGSDGGRPLGRVPALLITRVARSETVGAWIDRARYLTVRELRAEIAAAGQNGEPEPDRVRIRLPCPRALPTAFDEVLDLHRAVNAQESTATSLVEALVAESFSSPAPPDPVRQGRGSGLEPLRAWENRQRYENGLAVATGRWRAILDGPVPEGRAHTLLRKVLELEAAPDPGSSEALDARLRALVAVEGELERALGEVLDGMGADGAWARLRFAGVGHYVEERLGLSRSTGENRVRLRRALRRYRDIRGAYEDGRLGQEAALLIVRILGDGAASRDLQQQWLARAQAVTLKRLRDELRALRREGSDRDAEARESGRFATPARAPLDDAAWHASLRRAPGDSLRRVIHLGERTARDLVGGTDAAWLQSATFALSLPPELAQDLVDAIDARTRVLACGMPTGQEGPPRWSVESGSEVGVPPSQRLAELFSTHRRRVPAWVGLLALLEDYAMTWDDSRAHPRRKGRRIYVRDGWRCMAPGCTSRARLEEHHVRYRSRRGGHEPENRICLCRFHHQQGEHGGLASCRGRAPLGLLWRMGRIGADGAPLGGMFINEVRLDVRRHGGEL